MRRFIMYDNLGNQLGEVSAADVFAMERREEINGEHCLEITTTQVLRKNTRIVYQDGRGYWREYVVLGIDEEHASGKTVVGVYYCAWSLMVDLMGATVSKMPGTKTPVTAAVALADALSGQTRWTVGTVTNTATGGASMYDMSAWKALGVLLDTWGGEISTTINVDGYGVVTRKVDLYAEMGEQTAKRRYDFGADVKSVKRTYDDAPLYCRVSPRGKGEQTEGGGYGRKITIESVNGGKDYLEYAPMVDVAKVSDGNGGYQYPTVIIENGDIETPSELKTWAESVIEESCTPKVTYEIDAIQSGVEGVDVHGVSLGDAVQVVDRLFGDGVRVTGRVVSMVVDELNERNQTVKFGYLEDNLAAKFSDDGARALQAVINLSDTLSTAQYVKDLISRMNDEINATGGYTYITEGEGIRTYDTAVTDPLVGAEASKVVEIKGGSIRIANSKTAQGEWEWKSVFVSGHIAAELVTAAQITAGYIGSADSGNFWNLDTGEFQMAATTTVGGKTVHTIASEQASSAVETYDTNLNQLAVFNKLTNSGALKGLYMKNGELYINASYLASGIIASKDNSTYWNLDTNQLKLAPTTLLDSTNLSQAITDAGAANAMVRAYGSGVLVCRKSNTIGALVNANGSFDVVKVTWSGNTPTASTVYSSFGESSTIGLANNSHLLFDSYGMGLMFGSSTTLFYVGGTKTSPINYYMTWGSRLANSTIGRYSIAAGLNVTSSGSYSIAIGNQTKSTGAYSCAGGAGTIATADRSLAYGFYTSAAHADSIAFGYETKTGASYQMVVGKYNATNSNAFFVVGSGTADTARKNSLTVEYAAVRMFSSSNTGTVYVNGSSVHSSDRRLKRHESYLSDDACDMVRNLKPVLFTRNGAKHYGFYAQDVQDVDVHDTATVIDGDYDEQLGFAPLSLDYSALIAPLVAYAQSLEKRIEHLESVIERLEGDAK